MTRQDSGSVNDIAAPGPTLHHMNNSQSQPILHLLCELSLAYPAFNFQVEQYHRVRSGRSKGRADPALAKVHPLGKSPLLTTGAGRVIAESSAIIEYLLTTYDVDGKFRPSAEEESDGMDYVRYASLRALAIASFTPMTTLYTIMEELVARTPFFARLPFYLSYLVLKRAICQPEIEKLLRYLQDDVLSNGKGNFVMGSKMTAPDFLLSWPVDLSVQRGWIQPEDERWELLRNWHGRMRDREGWRKSLERGDGYDLANI